MKKMSEKANKILNIIKTFIEKNGYSPTVREIQKEANLKSIATVHEHIQRLEAKGYITYVKNKSRTIRILKGDIIE